MSSRNLPSTVDCENWVFVVVVDDDGLRQGSIWSCPMIQVQMEIISD